MVPIRAAVVGILLCLILYGMVEFFVVTATECDRMLYSEDQWRVCDCRGFEVVSQDSLEAGGRISGCIGGIEHISCYEEQGGQEVICQRSR